MKSKYGPKRVKTAHTDYNPAKRFIEFIQILTTADSVSKAEIQQKLNVRESAFYKYLGSARELFPINFEGTIGGNAYYSIDKTSLAKYFNIKHHHTSSS